MNPLPLVPQIVEQVFIDNPLAREQYRARLAEWQVGVLQAKVAALTPDVEEELYEEYDADTDG